MGVEKSTHWCSVIFSIHGFGGVVVVSMSDSGARGRSFSCHFL